MELLSKYAPINFLTTSLGALIGGSFVYITTPASKMGLEATLFLMGLMLAGIMLGISITTSASIIDDSVDDVVDNVILPQMITIGGLPMVTASVLWAIKNWRPLLPIIILASVGTILTIISRRVEHEAP